MLFMTGLYASSLLALLENEIQPSTTATVAAPLSRTEHLRILRAFYRAQINVNVFGDCVTMIRRRLCHVDTKLMNYHLFGLWQPWEFQEIKCVLDYRGALSPRLTQFWSADTDFGRSLFEEAISGASYYSFANLRHAMGKMRARPKNNLDEVLRSTATLKRMSTRLLEQEYYLHSMWWLRSKYHDVRMSKWPHGKYAYPADLRFEGDCLAAVSFAWVDAFDGKYTYDYFSSRVTGVRNRVELKELQFRASPDISACRVSDQLGYWMWDKPRLE